MRLGAIPTLLLENGPNLSAGKKDNRSAWLGDFSLRSASDPAPVNRYSGGTHHEITNPNSGTLPTGRTLYRFLGVPVVAQPDFWPAPLLLTALLAWVAGRRNPARSWLQRLGVGLFAMPVALFADIGHAMAHTASARLAGAPMDEILLSSGMPRTLYQENAVPPATHIRRSLGGPLFSLIGFS